MIAVEVEKLRRKIESMNLGPVALLIYLNKALLSSHVERTDVCVFDKLNKIVFVLYVSSNRARQLRSFLKIDVIFCCLIIFQVYSVCTHRSV